MRFYLYNISSWFVQLWQYVTGCMIGRHLWEYADNGHGGIYGEQWVQCVGSSLCHEIVDDVEEWDRMLERGVYTVDCGYVKTSRNNINTSHVQSR